jgi:hypothetical protein
MAGSRGFARPFEDDVNAGRLDAAWEAALREINAGEARPLDLTALRQAQDVTTKSAESTKVWINWFTLRLPFIEVHFHFFDWSLRSLCSLR